MKPTLEEELLLLQLASSIYQFLEGSIFQTRIAALEGISGRVDPFLVGSTVIGWDGTRPPFLLTTPHFPIVRAANFKPSRGSRTACAEQLAIREMVVRRKIPHILAIVVAGDVQPDDESGVASPTLHPCGHCRRMMQAIPQMNSETPIITTGLNDNSPIEQHTLAELLALHSPRPA